VLGALWLAVQHPHNKAACRPAVAHATRAVPDLHAVPADCVLEAGQMLFIPPGWWHYVQSTTVSFSVSYWWR
jgi:ribosomal protein L16 Arg81 hydroxylase